MTNAECCKRYRENLNSGYKKSLQLYYVRHKEGYRERDDRPRQKMFDILGRKCVKCGFDNPKALQFDHINGGGKKEILRFGGSRGMWREYLKLSPDEIRKKLQVLCANCNWIKS